MALNTTRTIDGRPARQNITIRNIFVVTATLLVMAGAWAWWASATVYHGYDNTETGGGVGNIVEDKESQSTIPVPLRTCGTTPAEARARGCRFELHNFAWVPPECYDDQLGDEWDAQPWQFAKSNVTPPVEDMIPQEVALQGELSDAWVPWYQHMTHCALIWKKYHRAVALGRPMDSWTHSYAHSSHCADMLVNWELAEWRHLFNSHLFLKFPTCGYDWRHQKEDVEHLIMNSSTKPHDHEHGHEGRSGSGMI